MTNSHATFVVFVVERFMNTSVYFLDLRLSVRYNLLKMRRRPLLIRKEH